MKNSLRIERLERDLEEAKKEILRLGAEGAEIKERFDSLKVEIGQLFQVLRKRTYLRQNGNQRTDREDQAFRETVARIFDC